MSGQTRKIIDVISQAGRKKLGAAIAKARSERDWSLDRMAAEIYNQVGYRVKPTEEEKGIYTTKATLVALEKGETKNPDYGLLAAIAALGIIPHPNPDVERPLNTFDFYDVLCERLDLETGEILDPCRCQPDEVQT